MKRTNLPTIIAVVIAIGLAVVLIYYGMKGDGDGGSGDKKGSFELVTSLPEPVEFELAPVPDGPKLDLGAKVKGPDGKDWKMTDLVGERAMVVLLDGDTKSRRTKAATRNIRRLIDGGEELNFPTIIMLPRGSTTSSGGSCSSSKTAKSESGSDPSRFARVLKPDGKSTSRSVADSTTW